MSWHKCFLCGCEYRDDSSESRFGYCPGCRRATTVKKEAPKKTKKGTTNEIRSKKHV